VLARLGGGLTDTTGTGISTGSTGSAGTGTGSTLPAAPDLDPKLLWYGTN